MTTTCRIIRIRTVLEKTGLSRSTLYRLIKKGAFPESIRIAERCVGWRESAVDSWAADQGQIDPTRPDEASPRR